MSEPTKLLSRSDSIEALVGFIGMVGCVGFRFGAVAAIFLASAALFVFALWGRRLV